MHRDLISFQRSSRLPRLVVTDLDGTLLNPQHTIPRRSIDALSHAQRYHLSVVPSQSLNNSDSASHDSALDSTLPIQIMIASGRSPRSIQKIIDLFGGLMVPDAVICCNGALNYNPRTKVISSPQFISLDQALFMVQRLRSEISQHGTPRDQISPSRNPQETGLGCELTKLGAQHDECASKAEEQEQEHDLLMAGRPGFACEVIWFTGVSALGEPTYAQDTTFVCDRTWELQRKHSIYYEYTVVDTTMEAFVQSLQIAEGGSGAGRRGGIIKLMALDRNRTAPAVYESLPETLKPATSFSIMTTAATAVPSIFEAANGLYNATETTKVAKSLSSSAGISPQVSLTYSGNYFLEISAAGVNKGLGLQKYCETHEISREYVVAFGDLLNDAEMLQFAGLGLCMGNGHADMKKLADRIIGTNAADGVAREIESWFL